MNFLDNCWDYNDGTSEIRMGKALRDGYRSWAFLMSKIDAHSKRVLLVKSTNRSNACKPIMSI